MTEKKEKRIGDLFETRIATSGSPTSERSIHDVLKEEEQALVRKVDVLSMQRLIAERERDIATLKGGTTPTGEPVVSAASQDKIKADMIAGIMTALAAQGKKPEEVAEYLKALSPDVLTATFTATQVNPMMAVLVSNMLREGKKPESMTVQDVIQLIKVVQPQTPQQQTDLAALVTAIGNVVKGSQPGTAPLTEFYASTLKPIVEKALEVRTQSADAQIAGPFTGIMSKVLDKIVEKGLMTTETPQSLDMQRTMLDFEKWKAEQQFEIQKLGIEKDAEANKWQSIISNVIQPTLRKAGPMIDDAFAAGQQRLRTATGLQQPQTGPSGQPTFLCDSCGTRISLMPPFPDTITCPRCGAIYSRQGTPPVTPPTVPSASYAT